MSMTNEEVINALEKYKSRYTQCAADAEANEVIDKSIKALKREPCTDAVSREDVLALAKEECETAVIPYRRFVKSVNALPSVTPERPKGEWIVKRINNPKSILNGCIKATCCSVCEKRFGFRTDFCPNCGADMREVSE